MPHCAAASFELVFKSNQSFYKDLTMHDPMLAGDGRSVFSSYCSQFDDGDTASKSGIDTDDVKRHTVWQALSSEPPHPAEPQNNLLSEFCVLPFTGVMFFIPSLPFGIKRWSLGDLSSCLLHQGVVKGPFPSGRKQMNLEL